MIFRHIAPNGSHTNKCISQIDLRSSISDVTGEMSRKTILAAKFYDKRRWPPRIVCACYNVGHSGTPLVVRYLYERQQSNTLALSLSPEVPT